MPKQNVSLFLLPQVSFDLDFLFYTQKSALCNPNNNISFLSFTHLLSLSPPSYHSSPSSSPPSSAMGPPRHRRLRRNTCFHHHRLPTFTAFAFLLFSSASAITLPQAAPSNGAFKQYYYHREEKDKGSSSTPAKAVADQKRTVGPGSLPPSCRSKCGWCAPCEPVHVPIQPGLSIPLEYYPEAWRCKCGNKLFMP